MSQSESSHSLIPEKFAAESVRVFSDGELIFTEGDDGREMFVVVEGVVEIFKKFPQGGHENEIKLATISRGDFLGEMSLLESLPRSASARAIGEVKLLAVHPGGFLLKIRRDPTFAFEIMQSLSRRIRVTNEALMNAMKQGHVTAEKLRDIHEAIQIAEFESKTA
ncbi:MAG: cyclic nucleotide-binding domain-containing protein [Bdellovibrionales bacterium]|jgi:CRP-like cAMP-binding protein|nr:cyclic nucleotide-binding domain-containing protein [Bdellovibrionales bacterium]